jgi:mono/diheme cytochrome c family protein
MYDVSRRVLFLAGTALFFSFFSSRPVFAAPHPIVAGFERFSADEKSAPAPLGQLLLGELNCISCHQSSAVPTSKQAPILDNVGSRVKVEFLTQYLSDPQSAKPGTTMPNLFRDDPEKAGKIEALVQFLATTGIPKEERGDLKATILGKETYAKVGCAICHGPRDLLGMPEKNAPANAIPLSDLKSKYTIPALTAFLDNPLQSRPSGRMPHVLADAKEARNVANYLLQGVKTSLIVGVGTTAYSYYEGEWNNLPDFSKLKPQATGTGPAFDLGVVKRDSNYAVRFEGVFQIDSPGEYRFTLNSDDGSRLLVDGKRVVNNDGIHPAQVARGGARLTKGIHKVEVDFFQGGGGAELSVEIEGPGFTLQNLGGFVAPTEEQLRAKMTLPKKDAPKGFTKNEALVEKGRQLFESVGCASCHQLKVNNKALASSLLAPALDKLRTDGGCLTDKAGLPSYGLSKLQQTVLSAAIKTPPTVSKEPAAVIARTMMTLNCYACHSRDKQGGPTEDLNKFFVTSQPEMGDEGRVPPPLDLVGAKLNPDYFKQILDKGADDRPYMLTSMPGFGQANAGHLVELFAALDKGKLPAIPPVTFAVNDVKVKAAGRHMVSGQAFACTKCHTFAGIKAEGVQGIDMTLMTKRVQRDWFHAYLIDPQKVRPGTRMPTAWPDGKSVLPNILDGKAVTQIEAIWVYLAQGRGAQVPPGLGPKSIPLLPIGEAIIYRNFIQGAGTRAIGVGYPEKISIAFDANDLRLAMIWQGAFIDAAKHWTDRGSGFEGPLGDNIIHLPEGNSFAVLESENTEWPKTKAREAGYKFLGYTLTPDERPTFKYSYNDVTIEDFPNPTPPKEGTLKRTFTLTTSKPVTNLYYRAAVGAKIEPAEAGWYKIDNLKVKLQGGEKPLIRQSGGKSELLVPVRFVDGKAQIVQEYAW